MKNFSIIIPIYNESGSIFKLVEEIYNELSKEGVEALLDDRPERAGVKFKDADLIGIPWRVVVGRDAETSEV